jgi:hypothetical protein
VRLEAEDFLFVTAIAKDRRPSSAPRIAEACTVRDDLNFFHRAFLTRSSLYHCASLHLPRGAEVILETFLKFCGVRRTFSGDNVITGESL